VWEDFRNEWFVPDWNRTEDVRDIYYAFSNDGIQFTRNVRVNYVPNAPIADCSDPQIAIDSNDTLKAVWFDSPFSYNNESMYLAVSAPPSLIVNTSKTIVGQGYAVLFNVTETNAGISNGTFSPTVLANTTMITTSILNPSNGTLNLSWNTTGIQLGRYLTTVTVGDVSTASSSITVTIPGDINGDFKVNLSDLVLLAQAYSTNPNSIPNGPHRWNPNADINSDGTVSIADLVILASHYGKHFP
jgi:hypothetical protein